ncbi:M48 family metallopeptidase [Janthinobacterium fluminis]|uniref:M48 family metallopeptidase n=1 Tax=Janthinobacterium fluminis TaxID=2987524 RepID=A0ABT5K3C0_9BURK|nr:M48 family metallopeptidase [Janthinobacterium fluminis]MDC8759374.1 M48 family metallopeptidase [Janthinobacterium fluminis]
MPGIANPPFNRLQAGGAAMLALLLAGCSTPPPVYISERERAPAAAGPRTAAPVVTQRMIAARDAVGKMVALQDRLYKVAAPLLINNADLCKGQARNLLGFTAKNKYSYPGEFADAAQAALGYNEHLQVSGVLSGSGAARAGLRKGDGLVAADGKLLPHGPNAETQAAGILGPLVASRATLTVTIARGGVDQNLSLPVTRACAFRVDLGNADNVNAYADGQRLMLTRGMINYAQNDESIAYVMAKEMAHNILGHAVTQRSAGTLSGMIENLSDVEPDLSMLIGNGGVKAMPQELDAAADTLALYLLARGGYGIDNAARFWQRLANAYPATVLNGYTAIHPAIAYRVGAINKTVAEIKAKQAGKKPLLP